MSTDDDGQAGVIMMAFVMGAITGAAAALLMAPAAGTETRRVLNEKARELDSAQSLVQLGLFELRSGNPVDARRAFRAALEREPQREDAVFFLGQLATEALPAPSSTHPDRPGR